MAITSVTAPQVYYKTPSEVLQVAVDFRGKLRQGEVLTGTPTLTVSTLTAASPAVSTAALVILGESVEPGKAVTFTASGGTADADYSILVSCGTSQSQTRQLYCRINVRTS
jgi:hypothetical protein